MGETIDLGPESGYNNNAGYKDIYSIIIDGAYGPFTLSPDRFGNNDYDSSMSTDELMAIFRSEYPGYDLSIVETLMNDRNSWQLYHDGCAATSISNVSNSSGFLDIWAFNQAYEGGPESCLSFAQLFSGSHTMMYIDNYVSTEVGYNDSSLGFGGLWDFTDGGSNGDDGSDDGSDDGEEECSNFLDFTTYLPEVSCPEECQNLAINDNTNFWNDCDTDGGHCVEVQGCYIEPVDDSYDYNWLIPQDECDAVYECAVDDLSLIHI